jgi:hypothetical protein
VLSGAVLCATALTGKQQCDGTGYCEQAPPDRSDYAEVSDPSCSLSRSRALSLSLALSLMSSSELTTFPPLGSTDLCEHVLGCTEEGWHGWCDYVT